MYHISSEGGREDDGETVARLVTELGKKEGHCPVVFQVIFWKGIFSGVLLV